MIGSLCSSQIGTFAQKCHGNFNFTHGNFNFLTANNAHGIFRFAHHLSTSDNFSSRQWPPKVKTQNQKSIFKVDLQSEKVKSKIESRYTNTYASRQ